MPLFTDEGEVQDIYTDVRSDDTENTWCILKYEGKQVVHGGSGTDYSEMLDNLTEDNRCYCYARFETGDEMSRRAKFAFITWVGPNVPPLKKAKVSTDKAFVKKIWVQFGKEIFSDEKSELKFDKILKTLEAASGAAYGTGK